jgi:hypothetical protein
VPHAPQISPSPIWSLVQFNNQELEFMFKYLFRYDIYRNTTMTEFLIYKKGFLRVTNDHQHQIRSETSQRTCSNSMRRQRGLPRNCHSIL